MKNFKNTGWATLWAVVLLPFVAAKPLPAKETLSLDGLIAMRNHHISEKNQTHVAP